MKLLRVGNRKRDKGKIKSGKQKTTVIYNLKKGNSYEGKGTHRIK